MKTEQKCKKCKVIKQINNFAARKYKTNNESKISYLTTCKECHNKKIKIKRNKPKGIRLWVDSTKGDLVCNECKILKSLDSFPTQKGRGVRKFYSRVCRKCISSRRTRLRNIGVIKKNERSEKQKKIDKLNYQNKYYRIKYNNNPSFKLRDVFSKTIRRQLKRNNSSKNGKSSFKHLDYSIKELKAHIESLFKSNLDNNGNTWMTWKNWGVYNVKTWDDNDSSTWKWQLDHIIPASLFKYTSMEDESFKKCWALDNLRPLSAKQNLLDGASKVRHKPDII